MAVKQLTRQELLDAVAFAFGGENLQREIEAVDQIVAHHGHVSVWQSRHGSFHVGRVGPVGWQRVAVYNP